MKTARSYLSVLLTLVLMLTQVSAFAKSESFYDFNESSHNRTSSDGLIISWDEASAGNIRLYNSNTYQLRIKFPNGTISKVVATVVKNSQNLEAYANHGTVTNGTETKGISTFTIDDINSDEVKIGAKSTSNHSEFYLEIYQLTVYYTKTRFTISVQPNFEAYGSVSGAGTYNLNQTITLTATPNTGYHFTSWYKNTTLVSNNPSINVTVTNDETYTAYFSAHEFTVNDDSDDYLAQPATCMANATYYKKCNECGAKGTETWTKTGSTVGHSFTAKILSASADANGLYSCCCDYGCGTADAEHKAIKDFAPTAEGTGKNLLLTPNGSAYSTATAIDLTDDNQFKDVSVAFTTPAAPTYTRPMSHQWGTLVVPFDVTVDNNNPYDFYTLSGVSGSTLTLQKLTGTLCAGTPVLVRINSKEVDGKNYELTLTANGSIVNTAISTGTAAGGLALNGAYTVTDITSQNGYIISNDAFWNIQTVKGDNNVYCAPFRAFLAGTAQGAPERLSIGADDVNALEAIDAISSGDAQIFDLNGHPISELREGINIVRRGSRSMKVVIK